MRKKFWTILLTAFVFLSGSALGISTVYRVENVTVNVQYVTADAKAEGERLQAKLEEAYQGNSTFFAKQKTAEEVLTANPYFRLTSFEKSYPKRLVIDLVEKAEIYAVEKTAGEEYYLLSSDGVVLDIRNGYKNPSNGEEPVLLKGLTATAEIGKIPTGDGYLTDMLALCDEFSTQLNGIRSNVVSVELIRREPEIVLSVTMREGVRIYLINPGAQTAEKVACALTKYFALSDAEKMSGRILLIENSGEIYADYSKMDDFTL